MPNFRNSKIYRLVSMFTTDEYIGSTVLELNKRFSKHKHDFKRWLDGKYHYVSSFQLIMYYDVKIELVETYPCLSFEELLKREQYWKDRTPNCCNQNEAINKNIHSHEQYKNEKIINCPYCNIEYKERNFRRHVRTQKHKDNVELFNKLLND